MKKESPYSFKNIALLILMALMTVGFHYFVATPEKQETEATVMIKNTKKGLYLFPLFPRYEVLVDGSDKAAKVSKETYDAIEIGDEIEGYMRADRHFVTEDQIKTEQKYYIPILIGLYLFWLFLILNALGLTRFIKRREKLNNAFEHIITGVQITILIIWLLAGFIVTSLIVTNVFHKLNKSNLIETKATVLDKDWSSIGSHKGRFSTFELLLLYSDKEDELYVTRKAVTRNTFNAYAVDDELTLFYRKDNTDDSFVQVKGFNEIWQAFVNYFTLLIGIYFVSVYILLRNWRERHRKKKGKRDKQETVHD